MTGFPRGNGAAWLDLLATLRGRYRGEPVDAIAGPARLAAWLAEHDLSPRATVRPDDVVLVQTVRETLHRLATAAVRGEHPRPADVATVEQVLATEAPLRLSIDGPAVVVRHPATVADALARLSREAVQDLTGPHRELLRACGDDGCSGIYLDHTGRRRWCSDERCGNRMRVRAHRDRVRARPDRPTTS